MKMFVQNVVIPDGADDEVALPVPDDEEAALPMPTLQFSVNRRKPMGRRRPNNYNGGGSNPDNGDALNFDNLTGESTIRGPRVDSEQVCLPSIAHAGAPTDRGIGETDLDVSECPECGFRFTSEDNMPEPVYRDYPKTRQGTGAAEIHCPRCGETID